jgi:hypothetical protein
VPEQAKKMHQRSFTSQAPGRSPYGSRQQNMTSSGFGVVVGGAGVAGGGRGRGGGGGSGKKPPPPPPSSQPPPPPPPSDGGLAGEGGDAGEDGGEYGGGGGGDEHDIPYPVHVSDRKPRMPRTRLLMACTAGARPHRRPAGASACGGCEAPLVSTGGCEAAHVPH